MTIVQFSFIWEVSFSLKMMDTVNITKFQIALKDLNEQTVAPSR
jgi:hypothetical protein